MYTLQQSIRWAQAYIEYAPLNAGLNQEPSVSIATMVRNTILSAPFTWPWNRATYTGANLDTTHQDYTFPISDFGFLEKVSLTDANGATFEVKDIINTDALGYISTTPNLGQRPNAAAVFSVNYGQDVTIRFMGYPDQVYTPTFIYQKVANQFGAYSVTSVGDSVGTVTLATVSVSGATTTYTGTITGGAANAFVGMTFTVVGFANSGNNTTITVTASTATTLVCTTTTQVNESHAATATANQAVYTGIFTPAVFPVNSVASISGFTTSANNGDFSVVSCTNTSLVLANPNAVSQSTVIGSAFNGNWSPIPDAFMDIYNNLFLAEALSVVGDVQEAAYYRQRGALVLVSKSEGLSEMQKNDFLSQFLIRDRQMMAGAMRTQMGVQKG
jgi:hypothetical protein